MWIMTPFGILMPSIRPPSTIEAGDLRGLQVRTRDRRALEVLREYMGSDLGRIVGTPRMDYQFRAYTTHDAFATATARMVLEIDYEKFKPESFYEDLHELYNDIWYEVFKHYDPRPKPKPKRKLKNVKL